MKTRPINRRGVALVLVILMISILVAVTLELNRSSRADIYDAVNLSDGIRLIYTAKSGFNAGVGLLLAHKGEIFTLTDDWANTGQLAEKSKALFHEGYFELFVEDESGKIQINRLVNGNDYNEDIRGMLVRLLGQPEFKLDDGRIHEIVDAIKDWIDPDNDITGAGAESAYYLSLANPYPVKNGRLDCIDELLMIKGMTKSLYYGTKEAPGLRQCLTVYGDGRININTAPRLVLKSLSKELSPEMADRMDEYRRSKDHDLSRASWYQKVPGMESMTMNPGLITTSGSFFKIVSIGILRRMSQTVTGVIKREQSQKTAKILSWKVE
jgi:general secretion pathway protein K